MNQEISQEHRDLAIETIKTILRLFHEKRYDEVPGAVDESEIEDLPDYLQTYIQGTLDLNGMDTFDEYGAPCNFHPQYEYRQLHFFPYRDGSGFAVDYEMTSGGELTYLTLQLEFLYENSGLKSVFRTIDPQ